MINRMNLFTIEKSYAKKLNNNIKRKNIIIIATVNIAIAVISRFINAGRNSIPIKPTGFCTNPLKSKAIVFSMKKVVYIIY
tara:strand:+ start:410 stop:652 length:243 start_codon:yes stop_codon:yes gene_type:complete